MTNFLVIMVTGGDHATSRSVELVDTNGTQICSLSGLPLKKYHHAQNGVTSCGGYDSPARFSCHTLSSSGSWEQTHSLNQARRFHSAWDSPQGIVLFGGLDSTTTTEILTENGGSNPSFTLNYDTL